MVGCCSASRCRIHESRFRVPNPRRNLPRPTAVPSPTSRLVVTLA
jgi:hypothetical protein